MIDSARAVLKGKCALAEKNMFGGLASLSNGKMFAGILKQNLVVRVGPEASDQALKVPHAKPMYFTGRPRKGYINVSPAGIKSASQLRAWHSRGQKFVSSLPSAKRKSRGRPY